MPGKFQTALHLPVSEGFLPLCGFQLLPAAASRQPIPLIRFLSPL